MDNALLIRKHMLDVSAIRASAAADGALQSAFNEVKQIQAFRFRHSYADLLASTVYGPACDFFLQELYGAGDFSRRDAQFAHIAGTLAAVFPDSVVDTAMQLAALHHLTEELDMAMATALLEASQIKDGDANRYVSAWQAVGRRSDRAAQLNGVIAIGNALCHLTRVPGLRWMLKLMRKPAAKAGLDDLQRFLEKGFDTFAVLQDHGAATSFLATIEERELLLIDALYAPAPQAIAAYEKALHK